MIQANELRIGNYFVEDGEIKQVNSHTWDDSVFDDLHPIPLTLEILEACGFEKGREVYRLSIESEYGCEIEMFYGKAFLHDCDGGIVGKEIKFLHQLQNLFFALTGEELIYTP